MRTCMLLLGAASAWSAAAQGQPQSSVAAEIAAIEQAWGQAFLTGNRAYLQSVLAPEFKLMRAEGGEALFTPRARWFETLPRYTFHLFEVRTTDVVAAGDTAVATVQGRWKVSYEGRGTREENFIVSDTFVRRGGAWQVVYRHSTPFPVPAAAAPAERGK
jgi:ketosteroid isomerase-like protein